MRKISTNFVVAVIIYAFVGCESNDLSFAVSPAIGFADAGAKVRASESVSVDINLALSTSLASTAQVTINVIGINGFVYGVDYTTEPAATNGLITLDLEAGVSETKVMYKGITTGINSDRSILFQLESGSGITIGQPATLSYNLVLTPLAPITISHDFEGCTEDFSIPNGFIEAIVAGFKEDRGWGCRDFGNNDTRGVRASAFGGTEGDDNAWLIMDAVNMSGYAEVNLKFDVISVYDGPGTLVVQWSSNYNGSGDPSNFTWTALSDINNQMPAPGSNTKQAISGEITGISGDKFYLAFQYKEGTSAASSSWDIDNLILTGN